MNSSFNVSHSGSPLFCLLGAGGYSSSLNTCVLEVVIIFFLTVLIIAGNLVVIFVFHCAPLLHHHTTSHFIQTMAYADLLVGVSCLVPSLSLLHYLQAFNERLTCKAFGYVISVLKSVSMASLACISVDRYIAITRPLSYATLVTPCRLRACIGLIWLYSAVIFLPSFLDWGKPGYHGDIFEWCAHSWETNSGFSTFIVGLLYAPAALTVCFTYGSIFKICRQHTREITQRHCVASAPRRRGTKASGGSAAKVVRTNATPWCCSASPASSTCCGCPTSSTLSWRAPGCTSTRWRPSSPPGWPLATASATASSTACPTASSARASAASSAGCFLHASAAPTPRRFPLRSALGGTLGATSDSGGPRLFWSPTLQGRLALTCAASAFPKGVGVRLPGSRGGSCEFAGR
ncbi:unnamed protein product [Tetraodon nigroviridis]|uniref:(spotted green pufferfish) hypothetical protein n=1 Tax=Tetraodon nigroviridis TaxID=99883 RepID=Q4RPN0_TETNG|nr:unnamed protein product [Tetraodon nigroviridis]